MLEGSIPDDQALSAGHLAALGTAADAPRGARTTRHGAQPMRTTDWMIALAPGAAAAIAIGTCATWGGIPAAAGNVTGSMSLMDFLGGGYRSARGIPVVNVPGCAPQGDNFNETLTAIVRYLGGTRELPPFDELGRPAWLFDQTVHRHCPKAGYYEEGVFSEEPGDNQCLVEIGCWGPVVQCNIVERGAINHMGGCMVAGGACIGCTMPGFPDKYSPFYKAPPGSALSGGVSKVTGGGIRRLRRMSMKNANREPIWDRAHDPTTAWGAAYGFDPEPARDGQLALLQEAAVPRLGQPRRPQQAAAAAQEHGDPAPEGRRSRGQHRRPAGARDHPRGAVMAYQPTAYAQPPAAHSHQVEFDPVSRVAGSLALRATLDGGGRASDATAMAGTFRGYEILLRERDVRDAIFISSRACGVCGGAHALCSALALEMICGVRPPQYGITIRNVLAGARQHGRPPDAPVPARRAGLLRAGRAATRTPSCGSARRARLRPAPGSTASGRCRTS